MKLTKELQVALCSLVTASGLACGASSLKGATFFADQFNYPNGGLTIADGSGANVSGGIWDSHSGNTFNDNVDVINGQAEVLNSGSEDVNRSAPGGLFMNTGDKWYFAALVTVNDTRVDPSTEAINNDYFIHFKDNTTSGFRGRVSLDDPSTGTGGAGFRFGLAATSGGQTAVWPTDSNFGQQYKIIGSYDFDSGNAELWVDPADQNSPKIVDTSTAGANLFVSALALRQDFITGGIANNQVLVDAVALGDDFGDVMRSVMIPEPTAALLFLIGAAATPSLRRKVA